MSADLDKLDELAAAATPQSHEIDTARTVIHDMDRAGDYYDVWCVCGQSVGKRLPNWKAGLPWSVEGELKKHKHDAEKRAAKAFQLALVNAWPAISAELRAAREVVEAATGFAEGRVEVDVTEIIETVVRDVANGLEPDMDNAVRWTAYALKEGEAAFALNAALDAWRAAVSNEEGVGT